MVKFWSISNVCLTCTLVLSLTAPSFSQNINVTTPFQSVSDSYFENFGVNFGFSIPGGRGHGSRGVGLSPTGRLTPNLTFSQNLGGGVPGGGGIGGGGQMNFGSQGGGGGFSMGLGLAQASGRTNTTTAVSLTTMNGAPANIASGAFVPFTTGFVPVLGQAQFNRPIDNAVTRAINSGQLSLGNPAYRTETSLSLPDRTYSEPNSSAIRGDASVNSIKAARARRLAEEKIQLQNQLAAAQQLYEQQKLVEARIALRQALQMTDDKQVKQEIKARIAEMRKK